MCLPWFRRKSSSDEKSSSKSHLNSTPSKESKAELTTAVQKPNAQKGKGPSHSPYSQARARELFNRYRDEEMADEEVIGSEGLEKLCQETQMDMEGAKPLVLAWILGAKALGRFSKQEWDSGTGTWQLDTTEKISLAVDDLHLVIFSGTGSDSSAGSKQTKKKETDAYNKTVLQQYQNDPSVAYRKFYTYLFELVKPEQARNVDMEIATAIWGTVLTPQYPLCGELVEFINEKKTYRGVNKDLWSMTLEFCQEFQLDSLDKYETEGAWPTLMDDFVTHRKKQESEGS